MLCILKKYICIKCPYTDNFSRFNLNTIYNNGILRLSEYFSLNSRPLIKKNHYCIYLKDKLPKDKDGRVSFGQVFHEYFYV